MLIINTDSRRPKAERRVVAWLEAFEGAGLVVPGVHIPGRRRYRRGGSEVDLLVFTPHACVILAVESVRFRVAGTLSCPGDGPWSLPDVVGDPIALRRKGDSNPLNPAADSRDDLRGVLEQKLADAASDLPVDVVVVVVPQYGYPVELVTKGMPVGCDVLLGNNSGELYRWLDARAYGDSEQWTADRLLVVLAALNITEITWGDLIGIGFPAAPVAQAGDRWGSVAAPQPPAPQFPVVWAPFTQSPASGVAGGQAVSAQQVGDRSRGPVSVADDFTTDGPARDEAEPDSAPIAAAVLATPVARSGPADESTAGQSIPDEAAAGHPASDEPEPHSPVEWMPATDSPIETHAEEDGNPGSPPAGPRAESDTAPQSATPARVFDDPTAAPDGTAPNHPVVEENVGAVAEPAVEPAAEHTTADKAVRSTVHEPVAPPPPAAGRPVAERSAVESATGGDAPIPAEPAGGRPAAPRPLPGVPRRPVESRKRRDIAAMLRAAAAFAVLIAGVWMLVNNHHARAHSGEANLPVVATSVVPPPFPAAGLPIAPPPPPPAEGVPDQAQLSVLGPGGRPCYPLQPNC
ncbi:hypothetical protein [Nocardia aurantia]|uniref:NERD domain-containing protein n=1 Tax=Nocardia aurantia TaxID=2585199 RepID=A0A7K0E0P7_9NOCA|nr:hypothetical protein [Nocardia aurantia]MQY31388.1 hypothetical protein [Nocardia aurantia]